MMMMYLYLYLIMMSLYKHKQKDTLTKMMMMYLYGVFRHKTWSELWWWCIHTYIHVVWRPLWLKSMINSFKKNHIWIFICLCQKYFIFLAQIPPPWLKILHLFQSNKSGWSWNFCATAVGYKMWDFVKRPISDFLKECNIL